MNIFLKRPKNAWLFALAPFLAACGDTEMRTLAWPFGVKYEVFVLAFADSNGDGKGDIRGLTSKLDHLENLGVNGVWLMPIMNSPSGTSTNGMPREFSNVRAGVAQPASREQTARQKTRVALVSMFRARLAA